MGLAHKLKGGPKCSKNPTQDRSSLFVCLFQDCSAEMDKGYDDCWHEVVYERIHRKFGCSYPWNVANLDSLKDEDVCQAPEEYQVLYYITTPVYKDLQTGHGIAAYPH